MRLRNIPRAAEEVPKHPCVIQNETAMKGSWNKNVFQNDHPLHIEIGMGQGDAQATAWGCDLTYDYVKINGDYRT